MFGVTDTGASALTSCSFPVQPKKHNQQASLYEIKQNAPISRLCNLIIGF